MTEKRKKLAIILLAVVAVLAVLYFAVLSPPLRTDEPADETQLLPGELMDSSGYIMMFERIEQSNISSISVHNSYGDWEMYKASDGNFYIRDHESVPYNKAAFSSLVVAAGYSATLGRVSDSCTGDALEEYGLTGDCSYYVIKSVGGAEYKVYIGDLIPTAGGYYARLEGRDAVYIIASDARTTLLAPVNAMAHSMVTYPLSSTKYYAVKDFYIMRGDDMKIWVDYTANEDGTGGYDTKAPQGYNASSDTLGTILSKFTEFAGKGAVALGPPGRLRIGCAGGRVVALFRQGISPLHTRLHGIGGVGHVPPRQIQQQAEHQQNCGCIPVPFHKHLSGRPFGGGLFLYQYDLFTVVKQHEHLFPGYVLSGQQSIQCGSIHAEKGEIFFVNRLIDEQWQHGRGLAVLWHGRGRDAAVRLHHTPVDILGRENILAAQCLGQIGRRDAKLGQFIFLYLAVADDCYRFAQEELGIFRAEPDKC